MMLIHTLTLIVLAILETFEKHNNGDEETPLPLQKIINDLENIIVLTATESQTFDDIRCLWTKKIIDCCNELNLQLVNNSSFNIKLARNQNK